MSKNAFYKIVKDDFIIFAETGNELPTYPRFPITQGLCGAALESGKPIIVANVHKDPRYRPTFHTTRSEIVVPMNEHRHILGMMDGTRRRSRKQGGCRCAFQLFPLCLTRSCCRHIDAMNAGYCRFVAGGGIELHADTASDSALAEKIWRLKSSWRIAHDVTDWFTLIFNVEYSYSIAEHHNVVQQRYVELSLPGTIILPDNWSIGTRYKTKIDFEKWRPLDSYGGSGVG